MLLTELTNAYIVLFKYVITFTKSRELIITDEETEGLEIWSNLPRIIQKEYVWNAK